VSRVGRKPVVIPGKVKVNIGADAVEIEGPKGKVKEEIKPLVKLEVKDGKELCVVKLKETQAADAYQGLIRALLANLITGVTEGFEKILEVHGVGFRVQSQGGKLQLQLGFSHSIEYSIPEGIEISVIKGNRIVIKGFNKHLVGETAAEVRHFYPPEPYKGKGIRYLNEHVRRKAGKAAVGIGAPGAGK